jgi:hypothetical protein
MIAVNKTAVMLPLPTRKLYAKLGAEHVAPVDVFAPLDALKARQSLR